MRPSSKELWNRVLTLAHGGEFFVSPMFREGTIRLSGGMYTSIAEAAAL